MTYICIELWESRGVPCQLSSTLSGVKLLKEFQAQYKTFESRRQELTNAEKLFDLPITMYADLMEVDRDLKHMAMVYDLYETQRVRGGGGGGWVGSTVCLGVCTI